LEQELASLNACSSSPFGSSFSRSENVVWTWLLIVVRVELTVVSALMRLPPLVASLTAPSILSTSCWMLFESSSTDSLALSPVSVSGLPRLPMSSFNCPVASFT
jgi:hypothetical protein